MSRLFGIETEYGIIVEGLTTSDWMAESIAVVKSVTVPNAVGWNYREEDPRRDMRGYTVSALSENPDDAQFDPPGSARLSREDERADRVLGNGARFYNDHGHPEYATPECRSLKELVAQDRAGERIALAAAHKHAQTKGVGVSLYKNNTDFHGSSYGTHENYLMRRDVATDRLISSLISFFATRQILCGAGKVGQETDLAPKAGIFQISQRADFFSVEASVDTLHNRPLVNTRDEPHSVPKDYRRLHVICGDANMSEFSTAIKVGVTHCVLTLIEEGFSAPLNLNEPIKAVKLISRDISLKAKVPTSQGELTAIQIQRLYLNAAKSLAGRDAAPAGCV